MKRRFFIAAIIAVFVPLIAFADDLKDMEGTWTVSAAEANGEKIESEEVKALTIKITGDRYEVKLKDRTESGSMTLDPASKPKSMDVTPIDGDNAGKLIKAIYEIEGDTMRVCYMLGDGTRPTEFSTTTSGVLMITYKREKK